MEAWPKKLDWSNVIEEELSLSRFFDKIGCTATQKDLTLSIYFYYVALLTNQLMPFASVIYAIVAEFGNSTDRCRNSFMPVYTPLWRRSFGVKVQSGKVSIVYQFADCLSNDGTLVPLIIS
jgi:hypothetical protein